MSIDAHHMRHALVLARRGLGLVWPNPAVGCVLVKDGVVIGRGLTQKGGRPHAESVALQMSGSLSNGATAYVTLEPCSHHGETPPCAEAFVKAGIATSKKNNAICSFIMIYCAGGYCIYRQIYRRYHLICNF